MKFIFLDEIYPHAWATLPNHSYEAWFDQCFGTCDFWDVALRKAGHESDTLIYNMEPDVLGIVSSLQPDVLCVQSVGKWPAHLIRARGVKSKLVGFCSYYAEADNMTGWDVLFTSFPWLPEKMKELRPQQRVEYLPLAFGAPVLERIPQPEVRDIPLSFVGGLGSIWKKGTEDMAAVAKAFPDQFRWWGYQVGRLPDELMATYQGPAWGRQYYNVLMRSRIVINRHGEIAKGFGNNMRQYEATGCGTTLFTDNRGELTDGGLGIWEYENIDHLIDLCETSFEDRGGWSKESVTTCAADNQSYILENHTYDHRVPEFIQVIESL